MARLRTLRAQAAEELREIIEKEYAPGDRLPSEVKLAELVGLSRNTVREAVGVLVSEGIVERKWGVGTTVLEPSTRPTFSMTAEITPIKDIITGSGHSAGLERFSVRLATPPTTIAEAINLPAGEEMWEIERVFTLDGRAAVYVQDWCLQVIAGHTVEPSPLNAVESDLIHLIREQTHEPLRGLDGQMHAVLGEADMPSDLVDVPLIRISQTCHLASGQPVIYTVLQFDTSVVDLSVRRSFAN